jgi:hypothetical protein
MPPGGTETNGNFPMHLEMYMENENRTPFILHLGRFTLGAVYATPGAMENLHSDEMKELLQRHAACDWGDCCEEDWESNCTAIHKGTRIFSVFTSYSGVRIWIITEADRSYTTVLLPSEY